MRRLLFFCGLVILSINSKAQTYGFGTITGDLGTGFALYSVNAYSPIRQENIYGLAATGTLPAMNVDVGINRYLGLSLRYRRGRYGSDGTDKIRGNDFTAGANFHVPLKYNYVDLPIGFRVGRTSLYGTTGNNESIDMSGNVIDFHVSPHIFFKNNLGAFLSLGFARHQFTNITMTDNEGTRWTRAEGASWKMRGLYFEIGLTGRLSAFK